MLYRGNGVHPQYSVSTVARRPGAPAGARVVPGFTESPEPLYLFVFPHFRTQNRFTLLLEMLLQEVPDDRPQNQRKAHREDHGADYLADPFGQAVRLFLLDAGCKGWCCHLVSLV